VDGKHHGYILVEPSVTDRAYQWLDGGPLEGEAPSELPAWLLAQATQPRVLQGPTIAGDAPGFDWMGEAGRAELASAMEACPNVERDDWLRMGMVLHMLDPNPHGLGYELWEWWSQLGEGAKKFDSKDQARVWLSFRRNKDASLHRESIFWWAREHGWRSTLDQGIDGQVSVIVESILTGPELAIAEPVGGVGRCPVPLIEETAAWISQHGGMFYPDASLVASLALASLSASRVYQGIDGSPAHLYFGLSAQSINEIRYALTGLEEILIESGLRRMMRVSRFGGPGAVYKTLLRSPASIYLTSELETLIRFARRQPSGASEVVLNLLADIYSRRDLQVDGADEFSLTKFTSGEDQPVIRNPSMSMLALLSGDAWELLAKQSEIGRGATELLFSVQCYPDDSFEHQAAPEAVPSWLVEHVRKVRRLPVKGHELDMDLGTIFAGNAEMRPDLIPVRFEVQPERFDKVLLGISDNRAMRPIIRGARTSMRRLCVALAAWADPERPSVSRPMAEWAATFVAHHAGRMVERLDVMSNDEGRVDVGQKVLAKLLDAGTHGMTQRDLVKYCRAFKALDREKQAELLAKLEEDGDIAIGDTKGRQRGRRIVAAKFVSADRTADMPTGADK
jgi:hypothetical protein